MTAYGCVLFCRLKLLGTLVVSDACEFGATALNALEVSENASVFDTALLPNGAGRVRAGMLDNDVIDEPAVGTELILVVANGDEVTGDVKLNKLGIGAVALDSISGFSVNVLPAVSGLSNIVDDVTLVAVVKDTFGVAFVPLAGTLNGVAREVESGEAMVDGTPIANNELLDAGRKLNEAELVVAGKADELLGLALLVTMLMAEVGANELVATGSSDSGLPALLLVVGATLPNTDVRPVELSKVGTVGMGLAMLRRPLLDAMLPNDGSELADAETGVDVENPADNGADDGISGLCTFIRAVRGVSTLHCCPFWFLNFSSLA